jgi:NAD(P)H-flavin reductase
MVMSVGKNTSEMSGLRQGEGILDVCGPLGQPAHVGKVGRVPLVAAASPPPLYPIDKDFRTEGNKVTAISGARDKDLLIYEAEMRGICDEVLITTDDGSYGNPFAGALLSARPAVGHGECSRPSFLYSVGPC